MSVARPLPVARTAPRVALAVPGELGEITLAALAARGLRGRRVDADQLANAIADGDLVGVLWSTNGGPAGAATLAPLCIAAAELGFPLLVLLDGGDEHPPAPPTMRARAHLHAHGAALLSSPDAFIEALALVSLFGVPAGPRVVVVAPPKSYVALAAAALGADGDLQRPSLSGRFASSAATDLILYDPSLAPPSGLATQCVPIIGRSESMGHDPLVLVGVAAAVAACMEVGLAGQRIALGLGPAPLTASRELDIDDERLARQLAKLGTWDRRIGDHETKVLLAAYGIATTRQAVATTPSAALRIAKKAGFPVELKRWGVDQPTENDGALVERNVTSAAELRRAYQAVLATGDGGDEEAVIVRETPPPGRELRAVITRDPDLGFTVVVEVPGTAAPMAAPAPLRLHDAKALAAHLPSSRSGDPEPDRAALANLLRRASHLVVDHADRITRLDLSRIVVGGSRTLVVDAAISLATPTKPF